MTQAVHNWGRGLAVAALVALVAGMAPVPAPARVAQAGPAAAAPAGTIYFGRITVPMDTLAVAPDGTGLTATGCGGDRTMSVPRRVLRVEPTGRTFQAVRWNGWQPVDEVRLAVTDDRCANATVLLELPARTTTVGANWSLDGRRVAAFLRRYDDTGILVEQGIWVGETGGACGDAVCGFHLAVKLPVVTVGSDATPYEFPIGGLSWSSDGRRLVYGRTPDPAHPTDAGIFVADVGEPYASDVRTDSQVAVPGGAAYGPVFSPVAGDDRIAFVQRVGTRSCARNDIFITTPAGGSSQRVNPGTVGVCQLLDPSWSPDGQWFAYSAWSGALADQQAIYRVRADGSGKPVLITSSRTAIYRVPAWKR